MFKFDLTNVAALDEMLEPAIKDALLRDASAHMVLADEFRQLEMVCSPPLHCFLVCSLDADSR